MKLAELETQHQEQLQACRAKAQLQQQQSDKALRTKEDDWALGQRELQRQLRQKEEHWESQRLTLSHGFEEQLRERERIARNKEVLVHVCALPFSPE